MSPYREMRTNAASDEKKLHKATGKRNCTWRTSVLHQRLLSLDSAVWIKWSWAPRKHVSCNLHHCKQPARTHHKVSWWQMSEPAGESRRNTPAGEARVLCGPWRCSSPDNMLSFFMEGNLRVISCLCRCIIRWSSVGKRCKMFEKAEVQIRKVVLELNCLLIALQYLTTPQGGEARFF